MSQRARALASLSLAAMGVVYGDIGTSPLYAFRECFHPSHGIPPTTSNVLGILSLIFWSLMFVVTLKYLLFILRADHKGEGGIMALIAMLFPERGAEASSRWKAPSKGVIALGLLGASLLYGDGIITPAISVLSAIEGLEVDTPALRSWVVPLTVVILIGLFAVQPRGTAKIGRIFGPAIVLWFLSILAIGLPWIFREPTVLRALNPAFAASFLWQGGLHAFLVLAAVVLCITGAEALYADMGHFGKTPIRLGWFGLVLPALVINYFGQGALILAKGEQALANPFYGLAEGWFHYPLIGIATAATVIASQALISGSFSLTQQAIQLGYLPRTRIVHTSHERVGQIYVPVVNRWLAAGCIALVLVFRESSELAGAYGIAVTGAMITTSVLFYLVARRRWGWNPFGAAALLGVFLVVDLAFCLANSSKLVQGGWIPIAIAGALFLIMATWKLGKEALAQALLANAMPLSQFLGVISRKRPPRVRGTVVVMTATEGIAPPPLLHHFRHNQVLHERVILLTVATSTLPVVGKNERLQVEELPHCFFRVRANYGYVETPDMSEILIFCLNAGLPLDIHELSFYLGRESVLPSGDFKMPRWRKRLFIFLTRNARPATDHFGLPPDQVIEIGTQVAI